MDMGQPGQVVRVGPLVRRVLADNGGPMTGPGTNSFVVGEGRVAIIDPGPDDAAHVAALLAAVAGEAVAAILCTHTHRDHSPAAAALARATGAPVVGCAPLLVDSGDPRIDAAFDRDYAPDRILADGESLAGDGWTLTAVATPGHASNHLCYALAQTGALFSGDHVMGWSTSIVAPPDGSMADYMASLEKLLARDDRVYHPAHGLPVETPRRTVRGMLGHRKHREGQILRLLRDAPRSLPDLVAAMYPGMSAALRPAAGLSVRAHLDDVTARGLAERHGDRWSASAT